MNAFLNTIAEYFMYHPIEFYSLIGILGLIMGSFLNVVVYRLPIILNRTLKEECYEYLNIPKPEELTTEEKIGLLFPSSSCPNCKHKIAAWQNIPVFSFIFLGGKCHYCKERISLRYPTIESLTAIVSIIVAWQLGFTLLTILGLILTWTLIIQACIDLEHTIIPDEITIPLLWTGLFISYFKIGFVNLETAFLGAVFGYLVLLLFYEGFKLFTKKEGMGFGDFKLLAMLGAWLGWKMIPQILIISSLLGTIVGIIGIIRKKYTKDSPIPFGPFLALAGWIAMLWGNKINYFYLKYITSW